MDIYGLVEYRGLDVVRTIVTTMLGSSEVRITIWQPRVTLKGRPPDCNESIQLSLDKLLYSTITSIIPQKILAPGHVADISGYATVSVCHAQALRSSRLPA
jgi:hypothetical protein